MLSGLEWAQGEFANGFCSLPSWAREGTSAAMQSEKVYSLGPAQACDSSHII